MFVVFRSNTNYGTERLTVTTDSDLSTVNVIVVISPLVRSAWSWSLTLKRKGLTMSYVILFQCEHVLKRSVNSILSTNASYFHKLSYTYRKYFSQSMKSCSIHKYLSAIKFNCINCYNKLKYWTNFAKNLLT